MNGSALNVTHVPAAAETAPRRKRDTDALWLQHVDLMLWIASAAFLGSLALAVMGD